MIHRGVYNMEIILLIVIYWNLLLNYVRIFQ